MECDTCGLFDDEDIPEYVAASAKVTKITKKKMKYSKAITLEIFAEAVTYHTERVFENCLLYPTLTEIKEGDTARVQGFLVDQYSIDLMDISPIDE